MIKRTLWGFVCWLIVIGPAYAGTLDVSYGNYACIAHRTVGLQSDSEKRDRFAGKIQLPVEGERFLLKIAEINNNDRAWCRTAKPGTLNVEDEYSYWWLCKSASEVTFSQGKYGLPLRGDGLHLFQDRLGGWFHIIQGLTYIFAYTDFGGNFYLEEGVCQKQ
jgi:hypothetical protein